MPKYIIWFVYYAIANDCHNAKTYLLKENDSISFYLYDVGYWKWHIDETIKESLPEEKHCVRCVDNVYAIYLISRNDIEGIIQIHRNTTTITLFINDQVFTIKLFNSRKRKRQ